jgi:hypothetical protein
MSAARDAEDFIHGLGKPEQVQSETLLERIVRPNATCEFGRRHGFSSITTVREYQRRVPISRYQDIQPGIERMLGGEPNVLVTEPVRRFFVTSGSSSRPKYVPVTSSFVRDKSRAFSIYWELVFQQHPELRSAKIVTNFADTVAGTEATVAGLPCSSESAYWSGIAAATQLGTKPLVPRCVARIRDSDSRYYAIARILLERDFQALVALNPSTLVLLFEKMNEFSALLLEDLARGGISTRFEVGEELRAYVRENHPANEARARALGDAIARSSGRLLASAAWPHLQLAVFWRSPMLQPYVRLLAPHLSSVAQRDYLSMASEGTMAIPVGDGASGGVVANGIHFYEFVLEEDAEKAAPDARLPEELEIGKRYVMVLSTSAGLYRYDIGDVFRVTGFVRRTPIIEFLHRAGNTCSVTGEKLTEDQVTEAMESVTKALRLAVESFTAAPAESGFPRYVFLVEFSSVPAQLALRGFCAEIDRALKASNIEYRAKRDSQRIGAPELWVVKRGEYQARRSRRLRQGASDLQLKPTHLTRDPAFPRQFEIVERIHAD